MKKESKNPSCKVVCTTSKEQEQLTFEQKFRSPGCQLTIGPRFQAVTPIEGHEDRNTVAMSFESKMDQKASTHQQRGENSNFD